MAIPVPVLAVWYVSAVLVPLFIFVSLVMTLVILIQKPRGGGLSGAFGGAGGSAQTAFGAKTGDVLTWFTVGCFVAFLLLAMGLTWTITPPKSADAGAITTPVNAPQVPATTGAATNPPAAPTVNTEFADEPIPAGENDGVTEQTGTVTVPETTPPVEAADQPGQPAAPTEATP